MMMDISDSEQAVKLMAQLLNPWTVAILVVAIIFRKNIAGFIDGMKEIWVKGKIGGQEFEGGAKRSLGENLQEEILRPLQRPALEQAEIAKTAINELLTLFRNYAFVGLQPPDGRRSSTVIFSEAYSGGTPRFINNLKSDLEKYLQTYSGSLEPKVRAPLEKLAEYVATIASHQIRDELLDSPVFEGNEFFSRVTKVIVAIFGDKPLFHA